jgi:FKBP-type peptidyl-prolyl cis-trans isomerase FkpA
MKQFFYLLTIIVCIAVISSCNSVEYKKTRTGLLYKIIPGGAKDSTKPGDWLKIQYIQKKNDDSVIQSSYNTMPIYEQVTPPNPTVAYNPVEIFPLLKKGDSAIIITFADSLLSKNIIPRLPYSYLKKGDKLTLTFKVVDVFTSDSAYRKDAEAEYTKNLPAIEKEKTLQEERQRKEMQAQIDQQMADMEKSGEAAAQRKVVEDYLSAKKINAQKTGRGTYVAITQQGSGPQAAAGKFVTVKYSGRVLATDSTFEANVYPNLQLGRNGVIPGWEEGLILFKEGGKGTIYIPGFLAYGKNPQPGSPFKPDEALIFDVEMLKVADSAQ